MHADLNTRMYLLSQAEVFLQIGRYDEAKAYFQRVLNDNPEDTDALIGLGALSIHEEHYAGAVERFEAALCVNPKLCRAQLGLALAYKLMGDQKKACVALEKSKTCDVL
jgi:tetratricopeptide (TPR) repeat protein